MTHIKVILLTPNDLQVYLRSDCINNFQYNGAGNFLECL